MRKWQLQDAKAKLSELVKTALSQGPQKITVHGKPCVVVIAHSEYDRMMKKTKPSLVDFMAQSPLAKVKLDLKRDPSTNRDVEL